MGIDIYAKWAGQTEEERQAQATGFSTEHGHVGYLREAYHGSPYATRKLLPEAFAADNAEAAISAQTLRERLPDVLKTVEERETKLYKATKEEVARAQKSFTDFVELCERKERETGQPVTVYASY
jgi:hypothetical protein